MPRAKAETKTKTRPGSKSPSRTKGPLALSGSCQCGKVTFTDDSETPVPFMYSFCTALPEAPAPDCVFLMLQSKPSWVSDQLLGKGARYPGF
ncbi:MAG: hypothetical protein ABI560_08275, partial [Myxococcales bacterium]